MRTDMVKWEYCIEDINVVDGIISVEKRLNELGEEGWELIQIRKVGLRDLYKSFYFKREKNE